MSLKAVPFLERPCRYAIGLKISRFVGAVIQGACRFVDASIVRNIKNIDESQQPLNLAMGKNRAFATFQRV